MNSNPAARLMIANRDAHHPAYATAQPNYHRVPASPDGIVLAGSR